MFVSTCALFDKQLTMAAVITGLIPILRTAVDSTASYKCRSLWFGFLCIRLVILFLAELPFSKLVSDFSCNTTRDICVSSCFNAHFHKPMIVAWNFIYVLFVLSVLLMEFFTSHLFSLAQKRSVWVKKDMELESQGNEDSPVSPTDGKSRMVVDLHKNKRTVGFYLFSIFLRILVELWFLYVLFFWNLPALGDVHHECSTALCSQLHICVLRAAPEKRMSIYALASISGLVVICSVIFCIYSIVHYIFKV